MLTDEKLARLRESTDRRERAMRDDSPETSGQFDEFAALRARVAELEAQLEITRGANDALARERDAINQQNEEITTEHEALVKAHEAERTRRKEAEAERDAYKRDLDAELAGNMALRRQHGARENETMFAFIARLAAFRLEVARLVGIVYQAEGHADQPGPDERVLAEVQALVDAAPHLVETRAQAFAERDQLAAVVERVRGVLAAVKRERERHWLVEHSASHEAIGNALDEVATSLEASLPKQEAPCSE